MYASTSNISSLCCHSCFCHKDLIIAVLVDLGCIDTCVYGSAGDPCSLLL